MKKTHNILRSLCAFVLCCVMLTGAAMAAEVSKVYDFDGTIVTFGDTNIDIPLLTRSTSLVNYSGKIRTSRTWSGPANADDGDTLFISVENTGDNDLRIKLTLTIDGEKVNDDRVVEAGRSYTTTIRNMKADSSYSYSLTVLPKTEGESSSCIAKVSLI